MLELMDQDNSEATSQCVIVAAIILKHLSSNSELLHPKWPLSTHSANDHLVLVTALAYFVERTHRTTE